MDPLQSIVPFLRPGLDNITPTAFSVLNWLFFALCTIAFGVRSYIRFVCFRRLILEDYIMLVALILHNAEAILIQLFAGYAFDMELVQRGDMSRLSPDFVPNTRSMLRALGTSVNLSMIGILLVKLNFLLFFRRLGTNVRRFKLLWWIVLVFTAAGAVAQIGYQRFECFFNDVTWILNSGQCDGPAARKDIMISAIFSAVQDAVSDFLIIGFPVAILWKSGIILRKKLILTFIFCLVFFTIAITIVRGSIFHSVYSEQEPQGQGTEQSVTFTWFWFYCEFSVAIIIACAVSFRTLFVQRENKTNDLRREQQRIQAAPRRGVIRRFHDSILDTCRSIEGEYLPGIPTGLMTVDFNDDSNWTKNVQTVDSDRSASKHLTSVESRRFEP